MSNLDRAGFVNRGGKGDHCNYRHPKGGRVTLSGQTGDDAKPYQEKEVRRAIKESRETQHIPVIIVSALGGELDVDRGFNAGANEYVTKPVDLNDLGQRIASIFRGIALRGREKVLVAVSSQIERSMLEYGLAQQGSAATNYQLYPVDRIFVQSDCRLRFDAHLTNLLDDADDRVPVALVVQLSVLEPCAYRRTPWKVAIRKRLVHDRHRRFRTPVG